MKEVYLEKLPGVFESAAILFWHVEEGDSVDEGQAILRLSVEGKSFNINSPIEGIVNEIFFVEGEEVKMGDLVATIDEVKKADEEESDEEEEEAF